MGEPMLVFPLREHARPLTPEESAARHLEILRLYAQYPDDDETVRREFNRWCDETGIP